MGSTLAMTDCHRAYTVCLRSYILFCSLLVYPFIVFFLLGSLIALFELCLLQCVVFSGHGALIARGHFGAFSGTSFGLVKRLLSSLCVSSRNGVFWRLAGPCLTACF